MTRADWIGGRATVAGLAVAKRLIPVLRTWVHGKRYGWGFHLAGPLVARAVYRKLTRFVPQKVQPRCFYSLPWADQASAGVPGTTVPGAAPIAPRASTQRSVSSSVNSSEGSASAGSQAPVSSSLSSWPGPQAERPRKSA